MEQISVRVGIGIATNTSNGHVHRTHTHTHVKKKSTKIYCFGHIECVIWNGWRYDCESGAYIENIRLPRHGKRAAIMREKKNINVTTRNTLFTFNIHLTALHTASRSAYSFGADDEVFIQFSLGCACIASIGAALDFTRTRSAQLYSATRFSTQRTNERTNTCFCYFI